MADYGINDIETLSFKDGVRKRIQMYLGSSDMQGVYNGIQEIISNSIDEFYMGYGTKIEIRLGPNNMIVITDKGRGIPFGIKEDGSNTLVDIFSRPHTGGKFNDKVYQSVAGLNGIGAKATCLSSIKFNVSVVRDGRHAMASFEKGNLISYKEEEWHDKTDRGTSIQFTPDQEVFNLEPINIEFDFLCSQCKNLSYLTKGLTFELVSGDKKVIYCAQNGLLDLIKDNVKNPIHSTPIYFEMKDGLNEIEIALQWTKNKEQSFVFTNGLHNSEGGTSLTGLKTSITRNINKVFGINLSGDMARTGLVYAVSCKTPNPSFANQTKTKINNPELRTLADRAFSEAFSQFNTYSAAEAKQIDDFLTREQKAEIAAERARNAVLTHTKEMNEASKKKVLMVDKLKDAQYLGEKATLLICEGDSAASALTVGRDVDNYGILPIRGKCINALSHPIEDVLENEEVKSILLALGITATSYNPKKLRYGRIGICVDADDDGCHIACLVIALLYVLCPQFVMEGRLCWLRAPLYKVQSGKTIEYYFNSSELPTNPKGEVSRFKGLGEQSSSDTEVSMFNPKYQRLEQIIPTEEGITVLKQLMGKEVQYRKDFVFSHIDFSKLDI